MPVCSWASDDAHIEFLWNRSQMTSLLKSTSQSHASPMQDDQETTRGWSWDLTLTSSPAASELSLIRATREGRSVLLLFFNSHNYHLHTHTKLSYFLASALLLLSCWWRCVCKYRSLVIRVIISQFSYSEIQVNLFEIPSARLATGPHART